eukprot:1148739-Pelagomonas_calceolata.AAC.1
MASNGPKGNILTSQFFPPSMQLSICTSCSSLPTFMYGSVVLPKKDQFKCLGVLVDKHMNLKVSEEHAVQP